MEGIEPTTPRLQITCSGQLSYIGNIVFPSADSEICFSNGVAKIGIFIELQYLSGKKCHIFSFFRKNTPKTVHQNHLSVDGTPFRDNPAPKPSYPAPTGYLIQIT